MLSLPAILPRHHLLSRPLEIDAHNGMQTLPAPQSSRRMTTSHTALSTLHADEQIIQLRKSSVRRYGANWLRPPGITKTLQSKLEEAQERLEQIEIQRRDAELRAQEEAARLATLGEPGANHDGLLDQEEQDLDADVPDAEHTGALSDEDAEFTASVTFDAPSLLHESPSNDTQVVLGMEDAELDGTLQDARDLEDIGMECDLDDDVPLAGSYEHTDTEQEDDSSSE
ncbi:uncharacterized protein PV09_09572 [Verruconis gallopava]|uniref:Uncharacterized protein n=1 Tax=Verruconis gallopava TaxID=253628 RepID=A0A0D1ZW09_9PEZI|nr:uncharacterized protein PV09_09572 [Verruconis gallopava]KIV98662.1 hypothetical protein PV09_09572 [Verruconis gallopava]